jgi:hypothetical protein
MTAEQHPKTRRALSRAELGRALWAVMGVGLTLLEGAVRLTLRAGQGLRGGMGLEHLLALGVGIGCFCYFEGYCALQTRFVPALITRAFAPKVGNLGWKGPLLAPLFAVGLVGAPRRDALRAWSSVLLIALAIAVVRRLPDPWRAIVDASVAAALWLGLLALLWQLKIAVAEQLRRTRANQAAQQLRLTPHPQLPEN